jgi:anthranilate phosphoribosyltransferase
VVGVLQERGAARAMVVHGHDGMDELTITGRSTVWEVRDGNVSQYELDPRDLGLAIVDADQIEGGDAAANAAIARQVFGGQPGACRDIVALNAAAGLVVSGTAGDLAEGLALAGSAIDEGRAAAVLDRLVEVSAG